MMRHRVVRVSFAVRAAALLSVSVLAAVAWLGGSRAATAAAAPPQRSTTPDSMRFVEHPDTYPIGWPSAHTPLVLANPFEHDANARRTGAKLYIAYNCIDCHGAGGSGSMGPSLADGRWRFGGRAGEVFESIYQGRPDGMPAWGGRIANDQIWMLVAYVRSLNGGRDVSTENFTGRTVERSGH